MSCYVLMISLLYLTMKLLYQKLSAEVIILIVLRDVNMLKEIEVNIKYCSFDYKDNNELCGSHTIVFH